MERPQISTGILVLTFGKEQAVCFDYEMLSTGILVLTFGKEQAVCFDYEMLSTFESKWDVELTQEESNDLLEVRDSLKPGEGFTQEVTDGGCGRQWIYVERIR